MPKTLAGKIVQKKQQTNTCMDNKYSVLWKTKAKKTFVVVEQASLCSLVLNLDTRLLCVVLTASPPKSDICSNCVFRLSQNEAILPVPRPAKEDKEKLWPGHKQLSGLYTKYQHANCSRAHLLIPKTF